MKDGFRSEAKDHIVTIMDAENEHWLSKEVEGYKEYKAISDKMLQKNPQWEQMNMVGFSGKQMVLRYTKQAW